MKFTLTCIDSDGTRSEKQFDSNYLVDVVDKTSDFLQGVGFVFDELEVKMPSDYEDSDPYDYDQLLKDKVSFIRANRINNK
jgi:hypothetical protein|tara:strand:+ start:3613 stop:3855 length:243 start_codon:yes stop_codon:yes gene_type:complete